MSCHDMLEWQCGSVRGAISDGRPYPIVLTAGQLAISRFLSNELPLLKLKKLTQSAGYLIFCASTLLCYRSLAGGHCERITEK
jgi:hypothetical protein